MSWIVKMNLTSMVFLGMLSFLSGSLSVVMLFKGFSYFLEWEIISMNSCSLEMSLIMDWMSMLFMSFVTFISSMVLFYSGGYMSGDKNIMRFMYLVLGFVVSMLFMIVSPNMISILLGWDGLGLVSYVLVIYYQNEKSANAGMLTALSNRVGDVAILISIALMFSLGSWNFIFYVESINMASMVGLTSLIVLAGMTKSAQIPFSAWLPAAMAAPTPVSALVHSSTLVTAGVYLLIRFSSALEGTKVQSFLFILASLTMFMAGLSANFEMDLKKIIALSTLSQLGVMMSILALGWPELAFFHLLTHALFKALLFMCAGVIIHVVGDYQDIRIMGALVNFMPLSVMSINLANLALCGTPFLAGFYSKDLILEIAFMSSLNEVCFWLFVISTALTVCYTFRLVFYSLAGDFNMFSMNMLSDEDKLMTWPMIGLGMGSIMGGSVLFWMILPSPEMICLSLEFKLLVLLVSILGGILGYIMNNMNLSYTLKSIKFYELVTFSGSMWFMPFLSTYGMNFKVLLTGEKYIQVSDMGWSEFYGGLGSYFLFTKMFKYLQKVQDNNIKAYMMMFFMWLVILLIMI
uniref:NADH dehydrogenase subunit 5 n=1 Tax=Glyphocrangon regalis TaxID=1616678 RepID=UPI0023D83C7B|nr:NADH dehydrogenase subunit 5 [Glyphocrangon regalis]WDD39095.1 NADH dehydrogenase subunit 5 [Glyphocrangon regalis]